MPFIFAKRNGISITPEPTIEEPFYPEGSTTILYDAALLNSYPAEDEEYNIWVIGPDSTVNKYSKTLSLMQTYTTGSEYHEPMSIYAPGDGYLYILHRLLGASPWQRLYRYNKDMTPTGEYWQIGGYLTGMDLSTVRPIDSTRFAAYRPGSGFYVLDLSTSAFTRVKTTSGNSGPSFGIGTGAGYMIYTYADSFTPRTTRRVYPTSAALTNRAFKHIVVDNASLSGLLKYATPALYEFNPETGAQGLITYGHATETGLIDGDRASTRFLTSTFYYINRHGSGMLVNDGGNIRILK